MLVRWYSLGSVGTAIVLAGGFATRLRPLTLTRPKPLLPILNKPLLDWIIEGLRDAGIKRVILSVRYLSDMIKRKYGDGSSYGVEILYAEEVRPLGDGGPINVVNETYGIDDTFLVVYGDVFSDVDYNDLIRFHKRMGGLATLVLTRVEDPSRYGVALLDETDRIISFIEKPARGEARSNLVNAGIYVFEPEALKYFKVKPPLKLSRHVIPRMVNDRVIYGYVHNGIWSDIGVPKDYMKANFQALQHMYPNGFISKTAEVGEGVEIIQPSFIGDNAKLLKECVIGPLTVIGSGCEIGPLTRIKESVLLERVVVDGAAYINGSVIGERTYMGKWVRVMEGSVLGDEIVIEDEVFIARNTVILPYKEIRGSINREGEVIL